MKSPCHAHRLRLGRYSGEGQIYLLTAVVRNRRPVFSTFAAGRLAVNAFQKAEQEQLAKSLAWVVMPDHIHWLIELQNSTLPSLMGRTKSRTTVGLNRLLKMEGTLWQSGFHDRAIRREEDLQAVARYLVANPLRAGLVKKIGDYPLWDAIWV
jgi:REP element-mobilizing transposase RayT